MKKNKEKSEQNKLLSKGNYGTFYKPIINRIGLESAVILNFLVYKYDYFINDKKEHKIMEGNKAFYITYKDIEEATGVKESKLGRKGNSNPLEILEKEGLIKRKTIQVTQLKKVYYTVIFDEVNKAYDKALEEQKVRRKERKRIKNEKVKLMLNKRNESIDSLLENAKIKPKKVKITNDSLILKNDSTQTVESSVSKVQKLHITKNKKTKNKKIKKKDTNLKNTDENTFSDEEINQMLNPQISRSDIFFSNEDEEELPDPQLLYDIIFKTRTGLLTSADFFNKIVTIFLKEEFKGYKMSVEDEVLIYESIINNPLFELENEDIEDRDETIEHLKTQNLTKQEITEEIDFDEEKYEHLYSRLWEKIMSNYLKIKENKLKPRFGNIFVGVKEMSENYAPFIERY
ncbi:hypothetical protein [Polaribacter atrinae]|uniref:Uncharacterized protein n=1 Tax=Polaribacter atrinae TaxID=1333662 RepID=A0A176TDR4_9FLAO|nr:hypothetical protein [Polaribacter atrinae]OAD46010.1 hypothetical protein LPB303_03585 [Polaribacter atrinae]